MSRASTSKRSQIPRDEQELYLRREIAAEILKLGQFFAQVYMAIVEKDRKDGLCGASVVDYLVGKENVGV